MTTALEGIATDNRIGASGTASDGRGENRTRPMLGSGSPPTAQIIALPDLHAGQHDEGANPTGDGTILKDWNPLHQIRAKLQVCVGEATLSVGELLGAKEHQVLRLDREIDQAVDLTIEGRVVARGQLVAVDGHFAVRLTELPVSLALGSGS
ncbi:FliM/FliN family flagellar motor switch protein [Variovorax paradoxus]|uniref:Flagellar motor switch protein FliN-like C-terminal domain-containing protein n=1 Tax=Variovorax paradoxus TaxID=34073 RepID=A0A6I6HBB4_VARPD|nr:FliM/FliN family flagellar motor switch protein [Variovorax paradoxus]QGW82256.1 hypothetical protein GOQ09_11990 [Variovorax paradoxus]